ncbi:MAG: asparagine synthase (glutamine-hydrolyzing), partial [Acidimicrobiales bacterium]
YTRLAVIDLSKEGHQPMVDRSGRYRIVFNGECYNFVQLRRELEAKGHSFRSHSDTEVVLAGFAEWGVNVLKRLRGMFGLAVWDSVDQRLILARDRAGQKPLHYHWHEGRLIFGSEIKTILAAPRVERHANLASLHRYMLFRYVPGHETGFKGIFRLPAGHFLTVEADGSNRIEPYWQLPPADEAQKRPQAQLEAELRDRFDDAVRARLVSDVPLGAFLSGGVDSSAVVASMALQMDQPVKTFTVGFDDGKIDERGFAQMVADRYQTDHTEYIVKPDFEAILDACGFYHDEPYADPVMIPTYCVSAVARRSVTVALNGDGADEIFYGYRRHAASRFGQQIDHAPLLLRKLGGRLGKRSMFDSERRFVRNVGNFLSGADQTPVDRFAQWVTYLDHQYLADLYSDEQQSELDHSAADMFAKYFDANSRAEDAAARADFETFLPDDLLVRVDIATMAVGLEGRSPFLDHELLEFAATIPASQKISNRFESKALLKKAMEPRLPREILYRPKMGFSMDPADFLSDTEALVRDTVLSPEARTRGLFKPEKVREIVDTHFSQGNKLGTPVWLLFMLERWFQTWIDPHSAPEAPPPTPSIG